MASASLGYVAPTCGVGGGREGECGTRGALGGGGRPPRPPARRFFEATIKPAPRGGQIKVGTSGRGSTAPLRWWGCDARWEAPSEHASGGVPTKYAHLHSRAGVAQKVTAAGAPLNRRSISGGWSACATPIGRADGVSTAAACGEGHGAIAGGCSPNLRKRALEVGLRWGSDTTRRTRAAKGEMAR